MKVVARRCTLLEDTYKEDKFSAIKVFENLLKKYTILLKEITTTDLDSLSGEAYYNLLSLFYNIEIEPEDYLKAFSNEGIQYDRFMDLSTRMVIENKKHSGFGNAITWSDPKDEVKLRVAAAANTKIDSTKKYYGLEIERMLDSKKIIIVGVKREKVNKVDWFVDNYKEYPIVDMDKYFNDNLEIFGNILRKKLTDKKIFNDLKKFIEELNYQLTTVTVYNQVLPQDINDQIKNWWLNSKLKNELKQTEKNIKKR